MLYNFEKDKNFNLLVEHKLKNTGALQNIDQAFTGHSVDISIAG